jgi:hypothetical protein
LAFWVAISTSTEEGSRRRRVADHTKKPVACFTSLAARRCAVYKTPPDSSPLRSHGLPPEAGHRRRC